MTVMSGSADGVYAELPPSLRKKVTCSDVCLLNKADQLCWDVAQLRPSRKDIAASNQATDASGSAFVGLVPIAAESSIASKLVNRPLPLDNPAKVSDRRKKELEVAKDERRKRKIAAKRRRSGRSVKGDATYLRPGSVRKPLVRGHLRCVHVV